MKTFTTLLLICSALVTQAQIGLYSAENNYLNSNYNCAGYNTGVLTYGENINNDAHLQNHYLTFSSPSSLVPSSPCPSWFGFMSRDSDGCYFVKRDGGVDMNGPAAARLEFSAKSSVDGAKIKVYIGSASSTSDFPSTSTWNTGSGDAFDVEFTLMTTTLTYVIDFAAFDQTKWDSWSDNIQVNVVGFAPTSAGIEYQIGHVTLGPLPVRYNPTETLRTNAGSSTCGTSANIPLGVIAVDDQTLIVNAEAGGYIQIDPSFVADQVVITDMVGRTETFTDNDFHTQLRGMLVLNCVSGNRVKKAKVVLN